MKTLFHTCIVFLNFTGLHWTVWFHHTVVQQAQLPSLEPLYEIMIWQTEAQFSAAWRLHLLIDFDEKAG